MQKGNKDVQIYTHQLIIIIILPQVFISHIYVSDVWREKFHVRLNMLIDCSTVKFLIIIFQLNGHYCFWQTFLRYKIIMIKQ